MKRSDFFKSLVGIAVAPIVGAKVLSELPPDDWHEMIEQGGEWTTKEPLYPVGAISTVWETGFYTVNNNEGMQKIYINGNLSDK